MLVFKYQVDWEAIKLDKYKANYLGNSLYGLSDKEKKSILIVLLMSYRCYVVSKGKGNK